MRANTELRRQYTNEPDEDRQIKALLALLKASDTPDAAEHEEIAVANDDGRRSEVGNDETR